MRPGDRVELIKHVRRAGRYPVDVGEQGVVEKRQHAIDGNTLQIESVVIVRWDGRDRSWSVPVSWLRPISAVERLGDLA